MADHYHNISYPGSDIGTLSHEKLLEELNCFNSTTLEAVPSQFGQLFLIVLYSLTSLIALLGNVTVIVVELYGSESAQNIRKYLINLAVSDIIIGVLCVPFTYTDFMLGQWIFPHWLCPTAQYVQLLSVFVTSLTLTIIGVERYMATLHPFSNIHRWLESHTHIMLIFTWVFGASYAVIPLENTYTRAFPLGNSTYYECSYDNELSLLKRRIFMYSNFILTFLLPLVVLICSYSAIMRKLLGDQRKPTRQYLPSTTNTTNNNTNTTNTSVHSSASTTELPGPVRPAPKAQTIKIVPKKLLIKAKFLNLTSKQNNSPDNGPQSPESVNSAKAKSFNKFQLRKSGPTNHRSKTIKMMFTVILLYGVCWMPIKLYQFLLDYGLITYCSETQLYALVCTYFVCHWIAMANSFVNPIVYSFMSKSFRNDFQKITKTFRKTFKKNKQQSSLKTISTQV